MSSSNANPNPPSGSRFWPSDLAGWAPILASTGGLLAVVFGLYFQVQANSRRLDHLEAALKEAASKTELQYIELRVQKVEGVVFEMNADVKYIRGRLEAK